MRVAIDGRYLQRPGSAERGIGTYLRGVLGHLRAVEPRIEAVLLCMGDEPPTRGGPPPDGVAVQRYAPPRLLRTRRSRLAYLLERGAFLGAARASRAAALLLPSPLSAPLFGRRPPAATIVYDAIPFVVPEARGTLLERALDDLFRRATRRTERIVTISRASALDVERVYGVPPTRISVAPCGIDARFRPPAADEAARVAARHGLARPYALYYGGFDPRKSVGALLDALAPRLERCGCDLALAGRLEPHERAILEGRAGRPGMDRVRHVGFVANEDLPALIGGARVLAFPSRYEGFGLPLAEAMACGTPAVAFDNSSIPEVAGGAAPLVRDGDFEALASAIERLLGDEAERRRLAALGVERARAFRWEDAARVVARTLLELGGGPR